MNYRELLELTKKHPNPFSINGRKTKIYDYQVQEYQGVQEDKEIEKVENFENNVKLQNAKKSFAEGKNKTSYATKKYR